MNTHARRGFSMVEMLITFLVLGLIFAFSIPAFFNLTASQQLKGATENIAAQLRLAREKAIGTGVAQPVHFAADSLESDYHIHPASGSITAKWKLPRGITYYSIGVNPTMKQDGRASASGDVILQDMRGNKDTLSVQLSGLVLTR